MANARSVWVGMVVALGAATIVGCAPSSVEGSGRVGAAAFSYAADNCQGEIRGHLNVNDTEQGVRFHGKIGALTQECDGCAYCADGEAQMLFTYKSTGESGDGAGCYGENVATLSVVTGPHAGYSVTGPVEDVQGGDLIPCE